MYHAPGLSRANFGGLFLYQALHIDIDDQIQAIVGCQHHIAPPEQPQFKYTTYFVALGAETLCHLEALHFACCWQLHQCFQLCLPFLQHLIFLHGLHCPPHTSCCQRCSRADLICEVVSRCMGTCCTRERTVGKSKPGSVVVSSSTTSGSGSSSVFNRQLAACTFISCMPSMIKILRRPSSVLRAESLCSARTCSMRMNCLSGGLEM